LKKEIYHQPASCSLAQATKAVVLGSPGTMEEAKKCIVETGTKMIEEAGAL
jgi:hypothetical protein